MTSLLSDYSLTSSHRGIGDYSSIGGSFNHGGLNPALEDYGEMDEECTDDESLPDDNTVFGIKSGDSDPKNQQREQSSEQRSRNQLDNKLDKQEVHDQGTISTSFPEEISDPDVHSTAVEKPCVSITIPDKAAVQARCGVPLESGISLAIVIELHSTKSSSLQRQEVFMGCTWEYIWESNLATSPADMSMNGQTSTVCIDFKTVIYP